MVIDRIVNPIVEECGGDLMAVNHNLVQGMERGFEVTSADYGTQRFCYQEPTPYW
ncbi:hypothetical protein JJB09_26235 [Rhizobium sp. KVB221]|uniref:Uncharacterized protein n=2 Tax=Rhizobium setariae TaxID=2801340 RepID=A0A936YWF0_9HYPH|nr:hypothetical protein [Rhizobium setariae]MBL0375511.1 hypothetical protein [Rhizobium setariae]